MNLAEHWVSELTLLVNDIVRGAQRRCELHEQLLNVSRRRWAEEEFDGLVVQLRANVDEMNHMTTALVLHKQLLDSACTALDPKYANVTRALADALVDEVASVMQYLELSKSAYELRLREDVYLCCCWLGPSSCAAKFERRADQAKEVVIAKRGRCFNLAVQQALLYDDFLRLQKARSTTATTAAVTTAGGTAAMSVLSAEEEEGGGGASKP
jgi:hypothetical protein